MTYKGWYAIKPKTIKKNSFFLPIFVFSPISSNIQGDPRPPKNQKKKNAEPINFFITLTNIKQNKSNFVHSNFCLCIIMPIIMEVPVV